MAATSSDASRRYVLPDDVVLSRNLAALWALDAGLAARIEALHPREPHPVHPSKAGPPTVAATLADGRSLFLHSRYDPAAEAERLVQGLDVAGQLVFHVFGFALGYHVDALRARASGEAVVCVYEPDLLMLRMRPGLVSILGNEYAEGLLSEMKLDKEPRSGCSRRSSSR